MELLLIRHAATDLSRENRYCGKTDAPLSDEGMLQLADLKKKLSDCPADMVYCSTRKRTRQTAGYLFPDNAAIPVPELDELNFGEWEGLTFEEISGTGGGLYERWIHDPFSVNPPGGESFDDLTGRTARFLGNIIIPGNENRKIVCVSHAGTLRAIISRLLKAKKEDFWNISIKLAGFCRFTLRNGVLVSHSLEELCGK
jgi:broad specificity phosphatase PhoE